MSRLLAGAAALALIAAVGCGERKPVGGNDGSGPTGSKGQRWKCGYHNGRAMMECIEVLRYLKTKAEQDKPTRR